MGLRIFLEKCENLIAEYKDNCRIQNNGTVLLNPGKMPRSRHALYKGLEQKHIKTFLVDAYENEMPKEYLELIEVFNGLNLFTVKINYKGEKGEFSFACPRFMIFGIPRTSSQNRKKDEEEPFDIRIEDLARHRKISKKWLKVGCYMKSMEDETYHDIFVDTYDGNVYICIKNKCKIDESWSSLDACLCELYDRLSMTDWEYDMK